MIKAFFRIIFQAIAVQMTTPDYLKKILTARVYDVARETELDYAPGLSAQLANRVYLKREDQQPIFSFKLRGAYNKMVGLSPDERAGGVITASAGNHAQGVALAAARLACHAVIVMPLTTPLMKITAVRMHGGEAVEVILHGDSFSDAYQHAQSLASQRGLIFVHAFDDPDVIAGQGTVAMEILRQHQESIAAIFVPIGGGGLIAGVAAYVKAVRPEIRIIGVQTDDASAMAQSLACRQRLTLDTVGLFSDGTAVKCVGEETLRLCQAYVDEIVLVDTDKLCAAIKTVFEETRSLLEPAGALAVAGMQVYLQRTQLKETTVIAILSGANMNFDRMRFVAERAQVGGAHEALFAVTIPEQRGSFKRFCTLIGQRHVTEFHYRIADQELAHLFVGLQTQNQDEAQALALTLTHHGFRAINLTTDELSKQHLRHMIGGRSPHAHDERLYRFEFPERAGALISFLSSLAPAWNISLFDYRNQGADYGSVLVGLQVPENELGALPSFLTALGLTYWDESSNPAYSLFLVNL
jgi:threonine dehydratase